MSESRRAERREFWEEAIRLWTTSGLSVREFCTREGLSEHTFYSRRRALSPDIAAPETNQESAIASDGEVLAAGRGRRRAQVAAADVPEATVSAPFIELVAPTPTSSCHCTLELENSEGAKMRIQVQSAAVPDLAAISRSFWNHSS